MFPLEKYKYFTDGKRKVIAQSTFAGKKYRGVAVCDSADEFDLEVGKKLAAYKCNLKICVARMKASTAELLKAKENVASVHAELDSATNYNSAALLEFVEAESLLDDLMKELK